MQSIREAAGRLGRSVFAVLLKHTDRVEQARKYTTQVCVLSSAVIFPV